MSYLRRLLIAIDQLAAAAFFGSMPDETISAMAYRRDWRRLERLINWLSRNPDHCREAYEAEMAGSQNAREYRRGNADR